MTKKEFLDKASCYISTPEHNGYYDLLDILGLVLDKMSSEQLKDIIKALKKKREFEQKRFEQ